MSYMETGGKNNSLTDFDVNEVRKGESRENSKLKLLADNDYQSYDCARRSVGINSTRSRRKSFNSS
jgi:hypothetical protein